MISGCNLIIVVFILKQRISFDSENKIKVVVVVIVVAVLLRIQVRHWLWDGCHYIKGSV